MELKVTHGAAPRKIACRRVATPAGTSFACREVQLPITPVNADPAGETWAAGEEVELHGIAPDATESRDQAFEDLGAKRDRRIFFWRRLWRSPGQRPGRCSASPHI